MFGGGMVEVEIDDSWFDPSSTLQRIDLENTIHAIDVDDPRLVQRHCPPRQPGPCTARYEGHSEFMERCHRVLHLRRRHGQPQQRLILLPGRSVLPSN